MQLVLITFRLAASNSILYLYCLSLPDKPSCLFKVHHSINMIVFILLYLLPLPFSRAQLPNFSPYFLFCNYHGDSHDYGIDDGEVVLSVQIEGDPQSYVPGRIYNISISSSETFDKFVMTALYTTPIRGQAVGTGGHNLMCNTIPGNRRPVRSLMIKWEAPPSGSGCVNFLASGTLGQQLLFKDTSVMLFCEEGTLQVENVQPKLAEVNSGSFVFREDFDSEDGFQSDLWSQTDGGSISDDCGSVVQGKAAVLCDPFEPRNMVTVPLNLTTAHVLQFSLGGGKCRSSNKTDQDIVIAYGTEDCTKWQEIERIKAPESKKSQTYIVSLPAASRLESVCIQFYQPSLRFNNAFSADKAGTVTDILTSEAWTTLGTSASYTASSTTLPTSSESSTTLPTSTESSTTQTTPSTESSTTQTTPSTESSTTQTTPSTESSTTQTTPSTESSTTQTTPSTESSTSQTAPSTESTTQTTPSTESITQSTPSTESSSQTTLSTEPSTTQSTPSTESSTSQTTPSTEPSTTQSTPSTEPSTTQTTASTESSTTSKTFSIASSPPPTRELSTPTTSSISNSSLAADASSTQSISVTQLDIETTDDYVTEGYVEPNDEPFDAQQVDTELYHNCWALDNIVVVNSDKPPNLLKETFDPIVLENWIFFPGAHIESQCFSNGYALVFDNRNQSSTYALTRDLDLDVGHVELEAILFVNFSKGSSSLKVDSGQIGLDCGVLHSGKYLIFDGSKNRQVCTDYFSPKEISAVRFNFQFGGGSCHSNSSSPHVLMYLEDEKGQTHVLKTLEAKHYQSSQVVASPVFNSITHKQYQGKVKFCLLQKSHGGLGRDVWSIDNLALLPLLPKESSRDFNKVLQVSVNLKCGAKSSDKTSISIEYSTDYGYSWNDFYTSCVPSACSGYYQSLSSVLSAKQMSRWTRVTLPIPLAALSPHTRFRIIHLDSVPTSWALDDVFIGTCEKWCSGHGQCLETGCSCDSGYEGDQCERPVHPALSSLHENFEDSSVVAVSSLMKVSGATVGYECSVVSSGKALVFNKAGPRSLTTSEIDTTAISSLQFTLRIGSMSVTSSCPPPDAPWEDIILEYSCNGAVSWKLLKELSNLEFKQPKSTSITLPSDAQQSLCQFRWRQPKHSGTGKDVWAIDDIIFSPEAMSGLLSIEMMDLPVLDERLSSNHGKLVDSFCGRMRSVVFSNKTKNGESRILMTKDLKVGPGYIAQFDLVMGCGIPYTKGLDNLVYFQYSVDHGISWHLVEDPCLPPSVCDLYRSGTIYPYSQFDKWDTVTIVLSQDIWSHQTIFRWIQPEWSDTDVWSINRVYIGYPCPDLCNGFGSCHNGTCSCDVGFNGETCTPEYQLDSSIQADFGHRYEPQKDFTIRGGAVVKPDEGCGIIVAGENLYFFKDGVRELVTKVLNTKADDFIQFYIQIGGSTANCKGAENRNESVLFSYTTNGGIVWNLLKELHHLEHRKSKFIHLTLPEDAKTPHTQFKWWQPHHSGAGHDQWAVDEILIGSYRKFTTLQDDFNSSLEPMLSDQWRMITEGVNGKYCRLTNPSLVLSNQVNDKFAVTKDVQLQPGDVIQFEINVGCGKQFRADYFVMFEYSHDHGKSWSLVEEPCYLDQDCDGKLTEGSVYHTGTHGQWTLIVIPVTETIAMHPAIFRWLQTGGVDHSFSIDNVYMGPPCVDNCHRRGVCHNGKCQCLDSLVEVVGENCAPVNPAPSGMLDRFDNQNMPSMVYWDKVLGGYLSRACGKVDNENALYFGGDGTREAVTFPLNTTDKKILEFYIKIGDSKNTEACHLPRERNEGVIVDYSTDNGITWKVLKIVEPAFDDIQPNSIVINLPAEAKKERTTFRFWQPLGMGEMPRAQWAIDSVLVGVNETSPLGFEDTFSGSSLHPDPHNWFLADSAVQRETCNSQDNALEFNNKKDNQLAETWDYHVTTSTFLQFDLAMNCGALPGNPYSIRLEYSTDHGQSWTSVVNECLPPNFECSGYHTSSTYPSNQYSNWTRVTVALPEKAISPSTRFRWLRPLPEKGGAIWAIDNVYVGQSCPWLCSGHGFCQKGVCHCDPGFGGEYCVPQSPLPMVLRDNFNSDQVDTSIWKEVYGGSNSDLCSPVVSGHSFTFNKDGLRMAMTVDMDSSMLVSMEFTFKYGCGSEAPFWPRDQSVLLQYSSNGGVTWKLLKEIHFSNTSQPKFYSLTLPSEARHNATRFRFWQAANGKEKRSVWSVDNLHIGTMISVPNIIVDSFDEEHPDPMSWNFVNDGVVDNFCSHQRSEALDNTALVFRRTGESELSAITSDIEIGSMSVIQFDINIGCGAEASAKYPVRLEYSTDGGLSWSLVSPNCAHGSLSGCFESSLPESVYYAGDSHSWKRIIIPLNHLHVCGNVRFRWYQGRIPDNDFGPEWAIDNVFIGMACPDHCNGHGYCLGGISCQCDEGYSGETCVPHEPNPVYLKDDFNGADSSSGYKLNFLLPVSTSDIQSTVNENNWKYWSGGVVSSQHGCGKIFTDASFIHARTGQRALTTVPLDLSKASTIQFYLKLGCNKTVSRTSAPVFLQYSNSGGIYWTTIEQFDFNPNSNQAAYISVHIPAGAQTNSTQVRWWQPSADGHYEENWAIDQVFIGGNVFGELTLQDDPNTPLNTTWLEHPGARHEPVCGSDGVVLHFRDKETQRFASTADVMVGDQSLLQFELSMGCDEKKVKTQQCFELTAEYSLDMGNTWSLLRTACLPSNVECGNFQQGSTFVSDTLIGWNRITLSLPKNTWSSQTRFRIHQPPGYNLDQDWAVQQLYIGSSCPNKCQGHGRCMENQCVCDAEWSGDDCSKPSRPLPSVLVEDFLGSYNQSNWARVVGGTVEQPCRLLSAGQALHFTGACSRILETQPLDLSGAMLIQFYFLYGCVSKPIRRDQGVLLEYSTDGGISWHHITEMHYNLFRTPRFISMKIPEEAKRVGTLLRWWQPQHGKSKDYDWFIDSIRVNGDEINPPHVIINFTSGFEFLDLITADNMEVGKYCGKDGVAVGRSKSYEPSVLSSREVKLSEDHVLQFSINVGCEKPWNFSIQPVNVEYSTDHGMTWMDLVTHCLEESSCLPHSHLAASHYHGALNIWRRIVLPLNGLPVSNGTRFRWHQLPDGLPNSQDWALADVYIGPACPEHCHGHGYCFMEKCVCDEGYSGLDCSVTTAQPVKYLKDTFEGDTKVNGTKWQWVQEGNIQTPCEILVDGSALVFNGPGARELVSSSLDLRDARFIQYTAFMWSKVSPLDTCGHPPDHKVQSVYLQFSTDGGIVWQTLHTLSPVRYWPARNDYILLPASARAINSLIRWIQAESPPMTSPRVNWAIDDVFIGGWEINPSEYQQSFDEDDHVLDDPSAWEFSPKGAIKGKEADCRPEGQNGSSMVWPDSAGDSSGVVQKFTTNQIIVQLGYMLQFKLIIGCGKYTDFCDAPSNVIKLEYRRNPSSNLWESVQPSCLPSSQNDGLCNPLNHHHASHYSISQFPVWTRVTIALPEVTFSSSTQFRWIQEGGKNGSLSWALDDIYIGDTCPDLCSGRGDCIQGICHCDPGYYGSACLPRASSLPTKMSDSFEGGLFPSRWHKVSGGGIGFGCGALLPYSHGKTLYFNGCGERQAITAELDTTDAVKIIFVIQIGCTAQTSSCNVQLGDGPNYRGILLQYTKNKGATWFLIAQHDASDYLRPKRVAYDIPAAAKNVGTQFRWWQPVHDGQGFDQWAIDHVEIISSRRSNKNHRRRN
ncbi:reelin [Biomphalaria glabrata]|nr:reelin [Biomphalaria glabrata]